MNTPTQDMVERLFSEIDTRRGGLCENPVTAGRFVFGVDPINPQKQEACRALLAREWFAQHGPPDAQPLPLSQYEIEDLKYNHRGPDPAFHHIFYRYVASLRCRDWNFKDHPGFEEFARGVMAMKDVPLVPRFVAEDEALCRRYPPRRLQGLTPFLMWLPPEQYERKMKERREMEERRVRRTAA
jgi:hypothetical protein